MPYKNNEAKLAYMKRWRRANWERFKKMHKKWRDKNPDKIAKYNRQGYLRRKKRDADEGRTAGPE